MPKIRHDKEVIKKARLLRSEGKTYTEIIQVLQIRIPKSTLSYWFTNTILPPHYVKRIQKLNLTNLHKGRSIALEINKIKREEYLKKVELNNIPIASKIKKPENAKIALAMLYLGEGLHSLKSRSFYFGNSNPMVILVFLELLRSIIPFQLEKVRCTVQCRADQDGEELIQYWSTITKIPKRLFYKTRIDPRTIGRPTLNQTYKGVLRIDYFDTRIRHELESLSFLIYNQLTKLGR